MTIHNKQWHNVAVSEARALGDIMSESTGGIISECPGDFIGIRTPTVEIFSAALVVNVRRLLAESWKHMSLPISPWESLVIHQFSRAISSALRTALTDIRMMSRFRAGCLITRNAVAND